MIFLAGRWMGVGREAFYTSLVGGLLKLVDIQRS